MTDLWTSYRVADLGEYACLPPLLITINQPRDVPAQQLSQRFHEPYLLFLSMYLEASVKERSDPNWSKAYPGRTIYHGTLMISIESNPRGDFIAYASAINTKDHSSSIVNSKMLQDHSNVPPSDVLQQFHTIVK